MAHWYHRCPLKATAPVNFALKMVVADTDALRLCNELKAARTCLLEKLSNPNNEVADIMKSLETYTSLFQGFLKAPDGTSPESKLRYAIRFKWTQTLQGNMPLGQQDAYYEIISILEDTALWFMKHGAMIAGKDDINMDEAKEVHTALRKAAGIWAAVKNVLLGQLIEKGQPGTDLDPQVISGYVNQCTAEAQEITLARAVELKHAPGLISALANETSRMYKTASELLKDLDPTKVGKWRKYLQIKMTFYESFAYCYCGENLLAQEKCGEAIRALQESEKLYTEAVKMCKEYSQMKGAGMAAKPDQHAFFLKLGPIVRRTLDKCQRENGFIYHQKVPPQVPELELKATFGLASPEEIKLDVEHHVLWTPVAYAAFDSVKGNPFDAATSKAATKAEGELPAVKEAPIHQSQKAPKNHSGCSLQ